MWFAFILLNTPPPGGLRVAVSVILVGSHPAEYLGLQARMRVGVSLVLTDMWFDFILLNDSSSRGG
jgi:hypothetical protein